MLACSPLFFTAAIFIAPKICLISLKVLMILPIDKDLFFFVCKFSCHSIIPHLIIVSNYITTVEQHYMSNIVDNKFEIF